MVGKETGGHCCMRIAGVIALSSLQNGVQSFRLAPVQGSLLHAAVGEGVAGDDLGDEGLHFVVGFGDGFHHLVDDDLIVAFELAAEGVG